MKGRKTRPWRLSKKAAIAIAGDLGAMMADQIQYADKSAAILTGCQEPTGAAPRSCRLCCNTRKLRGVEARSPHEDAVRLVWLCPRCLKMSRAFTRNWPAHHGEAQP